MNRSIFQLWKPIFLEKQNYKKLKTINLNFGPQHPAAHGVLRLLIQLNGEIVENMDPHIGLLHRGTEKLMESKNYIHSIPYFDRLDYVSMLMQEHAYCLAIESLLGVTNYSSSLIQIRTLYDELTRILNHLLAIACHALDVGSMSSIFWAFEEREKIMEFYERVSGARMHAAFYRPNDINANIITKELLYDISAFVKNCFITLNEMHNVLSFNKIWKQRLINIGSYNYQTCLDWGLTGVMSRSVGIKRDLRLSKLESYANYYYLNFRSYVGTNGDCYDRFLIRMYEMIESLNIVNQITQKLNIANNDNLKLSNYIQKRKNNYNIKTNSYNNMELLINHFKYWSGGVYIKSNFIYKAIESAKGEFGVTLISDNTNNPYRCKIRSPAYHHTQLVPTITKGHFLADLVTIIGSVDTVFGEVDR